jgi:ceramide glucosyltransferase
MLMSIVSHGHLASAAHDLSVTFHKSFYNLEVVIAINSWHTVWRMHTWLYQSIGTALAALGMIYSVIAWYAMQRRRAVAPSPTSNAPPITVLKPLCGAPPDIEQCLRTCCEQRYPVFQIVCGVSDEADPSVTIVRRLQIQYPQVDLQLVVDRRQHGSNRKVSNLINMLPHARHDHFVIADSDVLVPPNHLTALVGPLLQPDVGIVTCPYRGVPRRGLWSLLGSLFINDWFIPSVRVAALTGSRSFAFGASIAIRREVLRQIGGFNAIANQLADDYRLGELTRRRGMRTILSDVVVETCVDERTLSELIRHELRWLRTIRAVRPLGYSLAGITFSLPVAALGALLASGSQPALILLAIAAFARVMLHCAGRKASATLPQLWALPLADLLGFALWCWGFATRRVHWREDRFWVARDGSVQPIP